MSEYRMNKEEYREFVRATLERVINIVNAKNADYSHGDDPFANFRISEQVGVDPLRGLYIRMMDKDQRIKAWFNRGDLKVAGEGIEDAFFDKIGYTLLALGILEEARRNSLTGADTPFDKPGAIIPIERR